MEQSLCCRSINSVSNIATQKCHKIHNVLVYWIRELFCITSPFRELTDSYCYVSVRYEERSTMVYGSSFVSPDNFFLIRIWLIEYKHFTTGNGKCRTHRELEEMSKGENIVKWIKGQRISWLAHLEGMEEDRMLKKIFTEELEGTRRRGRPRKRWKEEVERDLQVLGVRR